MSTIPGVSPRSSLENCKTLSVRLDAKLHKELRQAAIEMKMSMGTLVELAVAEYLNSGETS